MGKQYELFRLADGYYRILLYKPDHNPPHIHLRDVSGQKAAIIEIESLEVIINDGFLDRELRYVCGYLRKRKTQILNRWHETQEDSES